MDVLVVRHALALDRDEAIRLGLPDRDRPLTTEGRTKMKRVARGLVSRVPQLSALLTSPWLRAVETADLLQKLYGSPKRIQTDALIPGAAPEELAEQVSALSPGSPSSTTPVAVVGHEPHLSSWVSWCLSGSLDSIVELRKGGACMLRFEERVGARCARLAWLMTPAMLRRL
jgi:phosphohistidine phosphatase